jgi:hypothetical protein
MLDQKYEKFDHICFGSFLWGWLKILRITKSAVVWLMFLLLNSCVITLWL